MQLAQNGGSTDIWTPWNDIIFVSIARPRNTVGNMGSHSVQQKQTKRRNQKKRKRHKHKQNAPRSVDEQSQESSSSPLSSRAEDIISSGTSRRTSYLAFLVVRVTLHWKVEHWQYWIV